MKPTPELLQHIAHLDPPAIDNRNLRPGWRIRTHLDQLMLDGAISPADHDAATQFRITAERANLDAPVAWRLSAAPMSPDAHARVLKAVALVTKLRTVADAIGPLPTALVIACVVQDRPWSETAKVAGRQPRTIRTWTIAAIQALAAVWDVAERRPAPSWVSEHQAYAKRRVARS